MFTGKKPKLFFIFHHLVKTMFTVGFGAKQVINNNMHWAKSLRVTPSIKNYFPDQSVAMCTWYDCPSRFNF